MQKDWFEMNDIKRKSFNNAVWIPLYVCEKLEHSGQIGYSGYKSEFFGCGTLAVPLAKRDRANDMGWDSIGIAYDSEPWIDERNGKYFSSDICTDRENQYLGIRLALIQEMETPESKDLFLHQDFVLALGLRREKDVWVRPSEGYIEVARIKRDTDWVPISLEVRAEHLRDYLCARKMALRMTTYRERVVIVREKPDFTFEGKESLGNYTWDGNINEIHEGGEPFGAKIAIFHVSRNDVDFSEDIPIMGEETDENTSSSFQEKSFSGKKCYRIYGEIWKNEWIEPSQYSPRIAHDKLPATIYFITDAEGHRENRDTLIKEGRWLWFSPSVINDITTRRGGNLTWYTAQTGRVGFLQSWTVHFGINQLGLINVYAKDIAELPDWIQQIWAGYNVAPDGRVSSELLSSQVKAIPADTQAPEEYLQKGIELLNQIFFNKNGFQLIKESEAWYGIVEKCHRFRCINKDGLYALAKDLARITADSIDTSKLQGIIKMEKGEHLGSLKSLERYLGTLTSASMAGSIMGPLFAIYDLRLADAHLPKSNYKNQFQLLNINEEGPFVWQGYMMLHMCVSTIYRIIQLLR